MAPSVERLDELLIAVGQGDKLAFRRLHDATRAHFLSILIARIGRRDLAEEALQESFIKTWQRAGSYDPMRGPAMPWLTTLVRNQAIDLFRTRRPDESGPTFEHALASCDAEGADPCRDAELAQHLSQLRRPLAGLPPQERTSVLLTCYAGYTHMEGAGLMQAPLGTFKSWVRRGLERLRGELGSLQVESSAP